MADYDRSIVKQHTDDLYTKANTIIGNYSWGGGSIGAFLGSFSFFISDGILAWMIIAASVAIGFWLGREIGKSEAFDIKLKAQKLLVQMQIEENTALIAKAVVKDSDVATEPGPP